MEERQVTVDGTTYPLTPPFMVIATQNPIEHEGTYPLPESQLDRFLMRVAIGYPARGRRARDPRHARRRTTRSTSSTPWSTAADVQAMVAAAATVHVAPSLKGYLVDLAEATRRHPASGPRHVAPGDARPAAGGAGPRRGRGPQLRRARRRQGARRAGARPPPRAHARGAAAGRRRRRRRSTTSSAASRCPAGRDQARARCSPVRDGLAARRLAGRARGRAAGVFGIFELFVLGAGVAALVVIALVWPFVRHARLRLDVARERAPQRGSTPAAPAGSSCRSRNAGPRAHAGAAPARPGHGHAGRRPARSARSRPASRAGPRTALPTERRGVIAIGPLDVEVTDPFGLAAVDHGCRGRDRAHRLPARRRRSPRSPHDARATTRTPAPSTRTRSAAHGRRLLRAAALRRRRRPAPGALARRPPATTS